MKRIIPILLLSLALACSKRLDQPTSFSIKVTYISPTRVEISIDPANPDVWYTVTGTSEGDMTFPMSDEIIADGSLDQFEMIYSSYQEFHDYRASFRDMFCYQGHVDFRLKEIQPGKKHRLIVCQVHPDTHKRIGEVYTLDVETPSIQKSDLTFDIKFEGSSVTITPSREGESFFWDYEKKDLIDANYSMSEDRFLYSLLDMYNQYGFIDHMVYSSTVLWDFAAQDRDRPTEGQTYTLAVAGVDTNGELTTRVYYERFVYHQNGIEVLPKEEWEL